MSGILKALSSILPVVLPLLRDLLGSGPGTKPGKALAALDSASIERLRQHRLGPWLFAEAARRGLEERLPPAAWGSLRQDYLIALQDAAREEEELYLVLQALAGAQVEPILLKGADLRLRLYPEAAVRPVADLDLLIPAEQLSRAQAALTAQGYRLTSWYHDPRPGYWRRFGHALDYWRPPAGLLLDLHWQILAVGGYYRLPYRLLRPAAAARDFRDLSVRLLAPEHLLILLCLRACNDRFQSVFQFLDLALALFRLELDWPWLVQETSRLKCQRPVYLVLRALAPLFPQAVPWQVLAKLRRYLPPWPERLALSPWPSRLTLNFPMLYQHYPVRDWAAYYAGKFWPRPEYLAANYGKPDRLAYLRQLLNPARPSG
jgi:hypothetical protein